MYDAMLTHRNLGPREVDEMLIWEIAVALGVHRDAEGSDTGEPRNVQRARARARAMQGIGEMPEPETPNYGEVAVLSQAAGG